MIQATRPTASTYFFTDDLINRRSVINEIAIAVLTITNFSILAGSFYVNHERNRLLDLGIFTYAGATLECLAYTLLSKKGTREYINWMNRWWKEIITLVGQPQYLYSDYAKLNPYIVATLVGMVATRTLYTTQARQQIYKSGWDLLYRPVPYTRLERPRPMLQGSPDNLGYLGIRKLAELALGAGLVWYGQSHKDNIFLLAGSLIALYPFGLIGRPIRLLNDRLQEGEVGWGAALLNRTITLAWHVRYLATAILLGVKHWSSWAAAGLSFGMIQDSERAAFQELSKRKVKPSSEWPKEHPLNTTIKGVSLALMFIWIGFIFYKDYFDPTAVISLSCFLLGLPAYFATKQVFDRFNDPNYDKLNPLLNQAYFNLLLYPAAFTFAYGILRQFQDEDRAQLDQDTLIPKIAGFLGFFMTGASSAINRFRQYAISKQKDYEFAPVPEIAIFSLTLLYLKAVQEAI